MRAQFFFLLILLLLASCIRDDKASRREAAAINHISVIIDDELWNGEIGDSIRNKFASPVTGLQQEEPLFTINQYPARLLEGFMANSRNVIVVKKQPGKRFKIVKDQFLKPQNIFYITGNTVAEIRRVLEKEAPAMVARIREAELREMQRRIDTALADPSVLRAKFGIELNYPPAYKPVLTAERFMWLKKDIISGNMSILVYEVPITGFKPGANVIERIVKLRDSVGAAHIHGPEPGSDMITEDAFAPYMSQITLSGKKAYETRGTWELRNDFMSGPFVSCAIADPARSRMLVVEGFCYAPSKDKRDLIHELEAIIKSVRFYD